MKKPDPRDAYVHGRTEVQQNQTGAGIHQDRRTRRSRSRSDREREARKDQDDNA